VVPNKCAVVEKRLGSTGLDKLKLSIIVQIDVENHDWLITSSTYAVGKTYLMCGCRIRANACDQPVLEATKYRSADNSTK